MDAVKCADIVVFVLGPHASLDEPSFDEHGYRTLAALKAQGLPSFMGVAHGSSDEMVTSNKKSGESQKFVTRYFETELGSDTKLFFANTAEDVKSVVRSFGSLALRDISWRQDRGYLLGQEAEYSIAHGELCIRGFMRGAGFRCKHLVHLTGHGDFTIARITVGKDPCPVSGVEQETEERIIDDLSSGEPSVLRLQPYDPTMEEQTWPTDEELRSARRNQIAAPESVSATSGGATSEDGTRDGERSGEDGGDGASDDDDASMASSGVGTEDAWDVSDLTMDPPNSEALESERRRRHQLLERSAEELEYPDEVDVPLDTPAKQRFQRYRGLKSFWNSPWDPYEDLPTSYSRVWEFEAFAATGRAFRRQYVDDCAELDDGKSEGRFVALYLKGVAPSVMEKQPANSPFVVSGLFPCEERVSVVHGSLTRARDYTEPVKSKQEFSTHCGFRRFMSKPIYSEIPKRASTCKKFKFMRFFHPGSTACASFYAPVMFPPTRMLTFTDTERGPELVASGDVAGADPQQLIIKRIVLTGSIFKTHKTKAVVRFMFFNPTDIRWFKPVELNTKKGLRGHITESLGTHGYMKCRFSNHIKADDTVCMNLYKRCYPKWYPITWGGRAEAKPEED
jgi:pre-rRNA-processing protein TSR1